MQARCKQGDKQDVQPTCMETNVPLLIYHVVVGEALVHFDMDGSDEVEVMRSKAMRSKSRGMLVDNVRIPSYLYIRNCENLWTKVIVVIVVIVVNRLCCT